LTHVFIQPRSVSADRERLSALESATGGGLRWHALTTSAWRCRSRPTRRQARRACHRHGLDQGAYPVGAHRVGRSGLRQRQHRSASSSCRRATTKRIWNARVGVKLNASGDNPLHICVISDDGDLAWSSPIYLFR